jgi:hypothetical protein
MFAFGPVDRVVPQVGGVAEAEELDGLGGDAAFGEVIAGDLGGGIAGQGGLPALGDLLVDEQKLVLEVARLRLAGGGFHFQRDAGAFGQAAHGVHEINVLIFANER